MKKWMIVFAFVSAMGMAAPSAAKESPIEMGVGYQGLIAGNYLNSLSVRTWLGENIGVETNAFYCRIDVDDPTQSKEKFADLMALGLRLMYSAKNTDHSRFYTGLEYTYGEFEVIDLTDTVRIRFYGVFVGSEFQFAELPELGFNFDIGYRVSEFENPNNSVDFDVDGISATLGAHYYF